MSAVPEISELAAPVSAAAAVDADEDEDVDSAGAADDVLGVTSAAATEFVELEATTWAAAGVAVVVTEVVEFTVVVAVDVVVDGSAAHLPRG